jgi:hypothetical protein
MYRVHTRTTHASKEEDSAMGQPARVIESDVEESTPRKRLDPRIVAKWKAFYDELPPLEREMIQAARESDPETP